MNDASSPRTAPAIHYRGRIAELDALRAIAVTIVILNHFWPKHLSLALYTLGGFGWAAVDAFFVLSGFLIAGILLDTRSAPDYFRKFYARRSLRIFPLYYLVLFIAVIMTRLAHSQDGSEYTHFLRTWGSPLWFFFYLGNFRMAFVGAMPTVFAFAPLWSLQIEEQFYLLFPLAVRRLREESLRRLLWCLVVAAPLLRLIFYLKNPLNPLPQLVLLPCHMEGLALGALIALRLRSKPWSISKIRLTVLTAGLLCLTAAGSLMSKPLLADQPWSSGFNRLAGYSLSSWACACVVLWLLVFRGSPSTRVLRAAPIQYLGKISYGMYLLHPLASRVLRWSAYSHLHWRPESLGYFMAIFAMTILLASLSWFAFEQPLLKLKDRVAPAPRIEPLSVGA